MGLEQMQGVSPRVNCETNTPSLCYKFVFCQGLFALVFVPTYQTQHTACRFHSEADLEAAGSVTTGMQLLTQPGCLTVCPHNTMSGTLNQLCWDAIQLA